MRTFPRPPLWGWAGPRQPRPRGLADRLAIFAGHAYAAAVPEVLQCLLAEEALLEANPADPQPPAGRRWCAASSQQCLFQFRIQFLVLSQPADPFCQLPNINPS